MPAWVGAFVCVGVLYKGENGVMDEKILQNVGIQPTKQEMK